MLRMQSVLSFLCVIPSLLSAFVQPAHGQSALSFPSSRVEISQKAGLALDKREAIGTYLVEELWALIADHDWKHVKKGMDQDFSGVNATLVQVNRREEIQVLKEQDVKFALVFVEHVNSPAPDLIAVQYLLNFSQTSDPDILLPEVHMSLFKKNKGSWVWAADAVL